MNLIRSIQTRDEAKPTVAEIVFAYPGFHVLTIFHPLAHKLWEMNLRAPARFWSNLGRFFTGIEIHPGATIGKNLFIDHGTGVVIGETAIIGDNCRLYHGVTLGGKGGEAPGKRRHPKLGNDVIVGAGAQVLGAITLGDGAKVGAASLLALDVPAGITAVGNPARLICKLNDGPCAYGLPDGMIPDPLIATMEGLSKELAALKSGMDRIRRARPEEYNGPEDI